jgi:hypothetical protein
VQAEELQERKGAAQGPILSNLISAKKITLRRIFTLEFRANFHPKTSDKCAADNFGLNS